MTEKQYHENNDLYNHWVSANEQKKNNLGNELINRIKTLEKQTESFVLDVLEKRTRLYNDENEEGYLPKKYDPFLNGPYRGKIEKLNSFSIEMNDLITSTQNSIKTAWINKILGIFPKNPFINFVDGKSLSTYIDNSLNLHELETIHQKTADKDNVIVQNFFNQLKKYPDYNPKFVLKCFSYWINYTKSIDTHIIAINQLSNQVQNYTNKVSEFTNLFKIYQKPKIKKKPLKTRKYGLTDLELKKIKEILSKVGVL